MEGSQRQFGSCWRSIWTFVCHVVPSSNRLSSATWIMSMKHSQKLQLSCSEQHTALSFTYKISFKWAHDLTRVASAASLNLLNICGRCTRAFQESCVPETWTVFPELRSTLQSAIITCRLHVVAGPLNTFPFLWFRLIPITMSSDTYFVQSKLLWSPLQLKATGPEALRQYINRKHSLQLSE